MSQPFNQFKQQWELKTPVFSITTSGSTGKPKQVELQKDLLIYSAQQTLGFLNSKPKGIFACLPLNKIGGFMQMVRAVVWKVPIVFQNPTANPDLLKVKNLTGLQASFTPLQLHAILKQKDSVNNLNQLHSILIGGGNFDFTLPPNLTVPIYYTYGMTETYSHIAIKQNKEDSFTPLGNIQVNVNKNDCLRLKGTITNNKWLQTTDIVTLTNTGFDIIGRAEFVINTGGFKIQIIAKENELALLCNLPPNSFCITSVKDPVYENKAILLCVQNMVDIIPLGFLKTNYIKQICVVPQILITSTQKIQRDFAQYTPLQIIDLD